MSELKACPNCGEDASIMVQFSETPPRWYVSCVHCGAETPEFSSPEEAATLWNNREKFYYELMPCPLCGRHYVVPILYRGGPNKGQYAIMCMVCGFRGGVAPTEYDALTSWNAHPFYDDD